MTAVVRLSVVVSMPVQRVCVVGMGHVMHQRAAPVMLGGLETIAQSLCVMRAQSTGHVQSLASANAPQVGQVQAVKSLYVSARMVASVLHLTHVSAQLSGRVISAH